MTDIPRQQEAADQPAGSVPTINFDLAASGGPSKGLTLKVSVSGVTTPAVLVLAIVPEADIASAKPLAPPGRREIEGIPFVRPIRPSGGTWDFEVPAFLCDASIYARPDGRRLTGWKVVACLAEAVLARPMSAAPTIGPVQALSPNDLPEGPSVLGCLPDKNRFSEIAGLRFIAIRGSDAGVFFYVDAGKVAVWKEKRFDADFAESPP
jgi:hypothetical protein